MAIVAPSAIDQKRVAELTEIEEKRLDERTRDVRQRCTSGPGSR